MDAEKANFEITRMARLLGVTRQGYYAWQRRRQHGPEPRAQRRAVIDQTVREQFQASDDVYGPRGSHTSSLPRAWWSTGTRSQRPCVVGGWRASVRACSLR